MRSFWRIGIVAVAALASLSARPAMACPFCSAVSLTFTEEIGSAPVAVFAKLVELPPKTDGAQDSFAATAEAKFETLEVLKGEKELGAAKGFSTLYFGDRPVGSTFLVTGIEPPKVSWATPIPVNDRARQYIAKALQLPKEGAERLVYFQDFLEDSDEMLARDAYDEFAKAPYAAVKELKPKMKHDQLVKWIRDPEIVPSRRRLYLTMLGVCGTDEDIVLLEKMMKSSDRQGKTALDALVAAYLTLKGPEGMPLIEELFLKNEKIEFTDTYAAVMALRFHGQEEKIIPRDRLLEGFRLMLDRPQLADLVIPDLARWEDWSAMDRLVELFKKADDESSWVRVPVIKYLQVCPLPIAKQRLAELSAIDPDAAKRANAFFSFGGSPLIPAGEKKIPAAEDKDPAQKPGATAPKEATPPKDNAALLPAGENSDGRNSGDGSGPANPAVRGRRSSSEVAARSGSAVLLAPKAAQNGAASVRSELVFAVLGAAVVLLTAVFLFIFHSGRRATT